MTFTLTDLIQDVYFKIGKASIKTVTGGSTTTFEVSGDADKHGKSDVWKNGLAIVVSTTDGLAPQGEYSTISGYNDDTATWTIGTLTAVIGAGDEVLFTDSIFPVEAIIRAVNLAFENKIGKLEFVDKTTLKILDDTIMYVSQLEWKHPSPHAIDMIPDGDDEPFPLFDFRYEPATAGSAGNIWFNRQFPTDSVLHIWYMAYHPQVADYDDEIDERIPRELLLYATVCEVLEWKANQTQEKKYMQMYDKFRKDFQFEFGKKSLPGKTQKRMKMPGMY